VLIIGLFVAGANVAHALYVLLKNKRFDVAGWKACNL